MFAPNIAQSARGLLLAGSLVSVACGEVTSSGDSEHREPTAMNVPATKEQMHDFRTALNRWSAIQSSTPLDVDHMVSSIEFVMVGVLGSSGPGRKAYSTPGAYDSYANLELRNLEVLKGTLKKPSDKAYVEVPWPNNVPLDELISATPVGARVILLADSVRNALEMAQLLESDQGIDAVGSVRANLLAAAAYGLLIEDVDGETHAPLWEQGPLVVSGADALKNFDDALAAIRAAAAR